MLMSAGLPLFKGLRVHGYWTRGESKMSKSLGNVIRPLDMKARYGMDAFRYFLLREMAFGQDATFSEDAFITRVNADLANNLGNLVSRTLAMQQRYFDGAVQPLGELTGEDRELARLFASGARRDAGARRATRLPPRPRSAVARHRRGEQVHRHHRAVHPRQGSGHPPRAGAVLHHLLEGLFVTAVLLKPFLPETADAPPGDLLDLPAERLCWWSGAAHCAESGT